jgi:LacI family transcriptional regulator
MSRDAAITIHDIARRAGVSPSTVSRVLNGGTPVAAAKRAAVMAIINSLHYRPNVVAQGLARGKSHSVGVLAQEISNLFFGQILKGIEHRLRGTGYYPLFASGWHAHEAIDALEMLLAHRVDSLIIVGGWVADEYLQQVAEQVPLVAISRTVAGLEDHCVQVENFHGAYKATKHLIDLGHQQIAHVTGLPHHPHAIDRREGYCQALVDAGLAVDADLILEGDFEEPSGLEAVQELIRTRKRFTALFMSNDRMAYGALLALYRQGFRVPEDVSVVGFDDQPSSAYTLPPLTTVRQPTFEIGAATAEAVLRLLQGERLSLPVVPTTLVVRDSTAPPLA